ncbi:hypothetical protein PWT90_04072 [Aphanocladium album]|nr:hypothetical protein PWT90_04072 [Aphanocladium album]
MAAGLVVTRLSVVEGANGGRRLAHDGWARNGAATGGSADERDFDSEGNTTELTQFDAIRWVFGSEKSSVNQRRSSSKTSADR